MTAKFLKCLLLYLPVVTMISCHSAGDKKIGPGTFGYDLDFLQKHDSVIVLKSGEASVIVSPKYQAKVFTSCAEGASGKSFGWINYKAFTAAPDPHINAYGGENRFWLGPEGGMYSLFFKPGDSMVFNNWHTPAAFDTEPWSVVMKNDRSVSMHKDMRLLNYLGFTLDIGGLRSVTIFSSREIDSVLACSIGSDVTSVGYTTQNTITNNGNFTWGETTGMPCIWILDMFPPSDHTTTVIRYKENPATKPATTDYFGEIPPERIRFSGNTLFFKADGKMRGKLGIHPERATPIAGSYDAEKKVLTITIFDVSNNADYLNQEWNPNKPPLSGGAVNAYNDGPLPGGGQLGPFYEIESVSPAGGLQRGESLVHNHSVFHFTGSEKALDAVARKVLGVSIDEIKRAFP